MRPMVAYVIAGVILGALARVLKGGPDAPAMLLTLPVGVVSAALGGLVGNLLVDASWRANTVPGFTVAAVTALVVLGLLEGLYAGGDDDEFVGER